MSEPASTNPVPSQGPDSAPQAPQPVRRASISLLTCLAESVRLMNMFYGLIYPVFLYFILASMTLSPLLSSTAAPNSLSPSPAWVLLMLCYLALWFVFQSGWHAAMVAGVRFWVKALPNHQLSQPDTTDTVDLSTSDLAQVPRGILQLFKAFGLGLGEYGMRFLLTGLLWYVLALALPSLALTVVGLKFIGVPKGFVTLWQQALGDPGMTVNQLAQALNQLGPAELAQLNHWGWLMLAMAAVILVTNALSLFWPQFLVLYNLNPLKTLWHSARFSLKHWPWALGIGILYGLAFIIILVLNNLSDLTSILAGLLQMFFIIQMSVLGFLVVLRLEGTGTDSPFSPTGT
ncbi:MAG: hypothetical protein KC474_00435 [Cyanobacteria bacterium HKST-UBA04]|nr:hypothetical protein [Cyanobacteria bacterium HKST-UBA04]